MEFKDSYWSTRNGQILIETLTELVKDRGYEDTIKFLIDVERLDFIPIIDVIKEILCKET